MDTPATAQSPLVLRPGNVRVIDFGPDGTGGFASFTVLSFTGRPVLRLSYATHPDGLGEKGDFWFETRATYLGEEVILPILPASPNRFDLFTVDHAGAYSAPLSQGLVRYARIAVEASSSGSVELSAFRFENRGTHSEEKVIGSFTCSDKRLNGIWKASVQTCKMASIPAREKPLHIVADGVETVLGPTHAYVSDGAKRDRLVWSGDLWWAGLNMYYAFGPKSPFMAGSLRMLAENQTPEGYVQACPYPESHGPLKTGDYGPFQSDEFAAWLVPVVYDYWMYTGDVQLLAALLPALERLMDYLERNCRADGLFEQRPETSKNAGALRFGAESLNHRSYMNVLLLGCYRMMAELVGDPARAAHYTANAENLLKAVQQNFSLTDGGLCKSLEDKAFDREATALYHALRGCADTPYPHGKYACIWHAKFQALAIHAMFESGLAEEAVAAIFEHNWAKLLDPDWKGMRTTYECMYMNTSGWGDEAHPDTAIAGLLSRYLLGVAPTAPGFAEFTFRPMKTTTVTFASGSVPTPRGQIHASWSYTDGKWAVDITVPDGLRGWLLLPDREPIELKPGHTEV